MCAIKDVYSGRIVGYSIDDRMKASLAVSALREPAGTIVHSDRGSQFRSKKFVKALHRNGLIGSMGRTGACGDNAAMEIVFRPTPEQRSGPATMEHPRRPTPGDRDLDPRPTR